MYIDKYIDIIIHIYISVDFENSLRDTSPSSYEINTFRKEFSLSNTDQYAISCTSAAVRKGATPIQKRRLSATDDDSIKTAVPSRYLSSR